MDSRAWALVVECMVTNGKAQKIRDAREARISVVREPQKQSQDSWPLKMITLTVDVKQ